MTTISVIVPTHNRPEFLAEALASVRTQTFTDYEVIVVSNGEDDDMQALSRACANRYGCVYFTLCQGNLPAARNFGIERAEGQWIAFLDDDDVWLPTKLEHQLAAARTTGADVITASVIEFYPNGHEATVTRKPIPDGWTYTEAICHEKWTIAPSAVIVRKSAILDVGGFDPGQRSGEDTDLWRRLSWRYKIHEMDAPLTRYRRGHNCMTADRLAAVRYHVRHFRKMMRDTPPDLRWTIPTPVTWIRRWLLRSLTPRFLRQPRKCCVAAMEMIGGAQPWFRIAIGLGLFLILSACWSLR